ncbi:hypothetical protein LTR56_014629 [Elasticomyces elasticus]|nr:hypothetical protein LTR56_014629 [Elasticomyces elasticus]KAK3645306.1 hypothetical protein LTR22_014771 [Elasticomyces elasticus]KAK4919852.1 hypothetical protein LTR49_012599 [Elasticomyces elasticus]
MAMSALNGNSTFIDSIDKTQVGANKLTIIFGLLATVLAVATIVLGLCQYRRMPSFRAEVLSGDIEMQQPIIASSSTNTSTRSASATTNASVMHDAAPEESSKSSIHSNTSAAPFAFKHKQEMKAPSSDLRMIPSKQQSSVRATRDHDIVPAYEPEAPSYEGAKGPDDRDSITFDVETTSSGKTGNLQTRRARSA